MGTKVILGGLKGVWGFPKPCSKIRISVARSPWGVLHCWGYAFKITPKWPENALECGHSIEKSSGIWDFFSTAFEPPNIYLKHHRSVWDEILGVQNALIITTARKPLKMAKIAFYVQIVTRSWIGRISSTPTCEFYRGHPNGFQTVTNWDPVVHA